MPPILTRQIQFLGATVTSFNATLGMGSQESTFSADLVEDCSRGDFLVLKDESLIVGAPAYFDLSSYGSNFAFGGVITNWTQSQGSSGRTFNVKMTDPRQLLENSVVVVDSYLGPPIGSINYFNVYAAIEGGVLNGDCSAFGSSYSNERGMPYDMIISALKNMNPVIYSPTGYGFYINFNSFPAGLPEFYRVPGPSITILQLLQDVCDVTGYDFYVYLDSDRIIQIGLIDLKSPPASFNNIIAAFDGKAIDLSYGQELRNEKTKTIVFGEKQHYLSFVNRFNYFFGEDVINGAAVPVTPYKFDGCGFWIRKKIESLNISLHRPIASNGPFEISEFDIRAAMASYKSWKNRTFNPDIKGSFNAAVRANWPEAQETIDAVIQQGVNPLGVAVKAVQKANMHKGVADAGNNPKLNNILSNKPEFVEDLEKVHGFIRNLGTTYYGKQFIATLEQRICYYRSENEVVYSDVPTGAGGWVDDGTSVLGLIDPELGLFREDDGRIGCFAVFNTSGNASPTSSTSTTTGNSNKIGIDEADFEQTAQDLSETGWMDIPGYTNPTSPPSP